MMFSIVVMPINCFFDGLVLRNNGGQAELPATALHCDNEAVNCIDPQDDRLSQGKMEKNLGERIEK